MHTMQHLALAFVDLQKRAANRTWHIRSAPSMA